MTFSADTTFSEIQDKDLGYTYPSNSDGKELDLRPASELSQRIVSNVIRLARQAREVSDQFVPECKAIDQTLDAFMPEDEWDEKVRAHDSRRPTTIVVPMTFAMREMFQTYMSKAFMGGDAIQRCRGKGSANAHIQGAKLELVGARQSLWFRDPLYMNTFFGDAFTYGRSMVALNWSKHKGPSSVNTEVSQLLQKVLRSRGMTSRVGEVIRSLEERILFEGVSLQPLDHYQTFYDPSVPPEDIQKSAFVGWIYEMTPFDLLRRERDPEENLFNGRYVRYLSQGGGGTSDLWAREGIRGTKGGTKSTEPSESRNRVHSIVMIVDLIPDDDQWQMGDGEYPERWRFEVSGNKVVIRADRLEYRHGMMPVAACAPNSNGHCAFPIGHLTTTYGFQKFADWIMKARMDAVNTILNGLIFYDASKVDEDDLLNPGMGKLVRINQSAYGEGGIDRYVHQMQIADPTVGHLGDIGTLDTMARNYNGTGDIIMGVMDNLPERPTKGGINTMAAQALSRLQRLAQIIDYQGLQSLAWQKFFNTQQFMSEDVYVPIIGNYEKDLRREYGDAREILITPLDVDVAFEVIPYTSSAPVDDISAQSEVVKTLFAVEGVGAQIAMEYRVGDIFQAVMRKMGFDDIGEFRTANGGQPLKLQVLPDQQVQQQVQAGNFV